MQEDCQQEAKPEWQSVKRRSLADEVTDVILHGGLQPGDRAGEAEISQRIGVSRGPVREALVRLENEGLITSVWHRGATVADFTRADVTELATLRGALEELATVEAVRSATQEDLERLQDVVEQMRSARDRGADQALIRLDVEFHDLVYQAAHHRRLYTAWTNIRSQVSFALLRRRAVDHDYTALDVEEHAALARSLAERNAEKSKVQIAAHLESAYSRLLAAYDNNHEAVTGRTYPAG